MNLKNKILIISVVIILMSMIGVYSVEFSENTQTPVISNETDTAGCCSIVLQLNDTHSIMTFRRDSNLIADIHIESFNWNGIQAIKQYKESDGYFYHVIITNNGWVIGFGGIDDGIDNERCVNITYDMVSNNKISKEGLKQIQDIKKPYKRGHVLIKSPNGNYGISTIDKIITGKLEPGEYVSIPNNYSYFRSGNISLDSDDKVRQMTELAQTDKYGFDRRDITTFCLNMEGSDNIVDVYVANEDGSHLNVNYTDCVDDVYFNNELTNADDIPIAPNYKDLGKITLTNSSNNFINTIFIIVSIILIGAISFGAYKFVRFIKFKIRR